MAFNKDQILVRTADGQNFVVAEEFTYTTLAGEVVTVPVGAETDGASTPMAIWNSIPPFGKYWKAAVLHDFLYRKTQYPKEWCDAVFLEAMQSLGVTAVGAQAIFEGVKQCGWAAYQADRESLA